MIDNKVKGPKSKINELIRRYMVLTIALFIMAFGVSLSVKANLGTSPISCVPYIISLFSPLTIGQATIIMHVVFISIQIILLRRNYKPLQLLQLPVAFIFGYFTDFTMWLLSDLHPSTYLLQWFFTMLSLVVIAFGVFLEVHAHVIMLAGEGLVLALYEVTHIEFGKIKVAADVLQVIIGITLSFIFLHGLYGIREGTLAASLVVGTLVRLFSRHFDFIDTFLSNDNPQRKDFPEEEEVLKQDC
jgi:uncharacterized membrane protein YczE